MELYLDANAHLPLHPKALKAYQEFCQSPAGHGNPSSPSFPGRQAALALEIARGKIASLLGAEKPSQIIFTSTCTQAAEWAMEMFYGIKLSHKNKWTFTSSLLEHSAIRDPFNTFAQLDIAENFEVQYLPVNQDGIIDTSKSYDKVCCIHVQNEIGTIQNLNSIKCEFLLSDMSQSVGKIPINLSELKVDIAIFSAHKFMGSNMGFIYLKNPNWYHTFGSGSRYFMDRPGTADVGSAVATAVALEEAINTLPQRTEKMKAFQTTLENGLEQKGFEIIGKKANRSSNTTFVNIPKKALSCVLSLSELGIYTALGSACNSMFTGKSLLMDALGKEGDAHDFMRISQFGDYGEQEAKYFLQTLEKVL